MIDYEEAESFPRPVRTALYYCCDVLLHTPVQEVKPTMIVALTYIVF